jgi:hypothetical protein
MHPIAAPATIILPEARAAALPRASSLQQPATARRPGGENGVLRAAARLAGRRYAATGGRHAPDRDAGDECENLGNNPMQQPAAREPATGRPCPTRACHRACPGGALVPGVWCLIFIGTEGRAATAGRHALGRDEGDECENLGKDPMQQPAAKLRPGGERSGHRVPVWLADKHRAAMGGRHAPDQDAGDECENLGNNPMQQPATGLVPLGRLSRGSTRW